MLPKLNMHMVPSPMASTKLLRFNAHPGVKQKQCRRRGIFHTQLIGQPYALLKHEHIMHAAVVGWDRQRPFKDASLADALLCEAESPAVDSGYSKLHGSLGTLLSWTGSTLQHSQGPRCIKHTHTMVGAQSACSRLDIHGIRIGVLPAAQHGEAFLPLPHLRARHL